MSDPTRAKLSARAHGHAKVFQVAAGDMHIVNNTYYGGATGHPAPLDLPELRSWLSRALADFRSREMQLPGRERRLYESDLVGVHQILSGEKNLLRKDAVRRLVVAGVVEYVTLARAVELPLSEHTALDLVVFALWPVVQAPALPAGWESDLVELTSPRLTAVVVEARSRQSQGHPVSCEMFTRAVAAKPFARAVVALLEDLANPREGGSILTALALANRIPPPPTRMGPRAMLAWFVAGIATASAVESERLDKIVADFVNILWAWSIGRIDTLPNLSPNEDDDISRRHQGTSSDSDSGFTDMLDGIIDSFFQ